jgi:PAS domain S-box-containing protein
MKPTYEQLEARVRILEHALNSDSERKSLLRTQFAMDRAQDSILWVGDDGSIVYANDSACRSMEYTREELLRLKVFDIDPDFPLSNWEQHKIDMRRLGSMTFESRHRTKRGRTFPVEVSTNFFEFEGGYLACAFDRDITARKEAEQALRESEERLRLALNAANQGMFDADFRTGRIIVSPEYARLLGYEPDEMSETITAWRDRLHPDDRDRTLGILEDYLMGRIPEYRAEFRQRTKSGEWLWILSIGKVEAREKNGAPIRMLGTITDITPQKLAEEKIRSLNAELEKRVIERTAQLTAANNELEAFSYSVSHDLRAPLRGISGFTNILLEDHGEKLDDEARRICSVIVENTKKMGELIEDLLAFSRFARKEIKRSSIDMNTLIRSVYSGLLDAPHREKFSFSTGDLENCCGDPVLIRQVVSNLLSNAIKFSERKENPEIEITGKRKGNMVVYTVKDNGVGFDMKYADKLFKVFQRLHSSTEFEGTGAGLAIVQRIVHRHGGEVGAESVRGQGAAFWFSLPAV